MYQQSQYEYPQKLSDISYPASGMAERLTDAAWAAAPCNVAASMDLDLCGATEAEAMSSSGELGV